MSIIVSDFWDNISIFWDNKIGASSRNTFIVEGYVTIKRIVK